MAVRIVKKGLMRRVYTGLSFDANTSNTVGRTVVIPVTITSSLSPSPSSSPLSLSLMCTIVIGIIVAITITIITVVASSSSSSSLRIYRRALNTAPYTLAGCRMLGGGGAMFRPGAGRGAPPHPTLPTPPLHHHPFLHDGRVSEDAAPSLSGRTLLLDGPHSTGGL